MADDVLTRDTDGNLAVRTVSSTGDNYVNKDDVYTRDSDGKLCVRTTGQGGGGDQHNLGYYATQSALEEAYPTATAGDWAIVGATDTVWIWDTDTSAWKDSDQKGQVTSVNGQTGAVVLNANNVGAIPQYSTMPTATAEMVGNIVQFTGTTNANYTNGYFYKCVSDGQNPATYSWTQVNVQPAPVIPDPLPSQTGNSGKFLTTDGSAASWATINALTNNTTANNSIGISDVQVDRYNCVVIGTGSKTAANRGTAIGDSATTGSLGVAVGNSSNAGWGSDYSTRKDCVTAIGANTNATANNAIAIGYNCANSTTQTLAVCVDGTNSVTLVSSDGTIPTARLTKVNSTITLTAAGWSSNTQTVNVTGVTATNVVFVSPAPASAADYASAGIVCTAQGAGTLTFTCTTTPTNAITVNVVCL